ncbi:tetratricopeptide repeat protein [Saccharothrix sp.]|uniref:tetratricopeptide repeat protein n=1 Tax=Saccharothrix sp. TaxID=1873460 RepID=UPI0028110AFA|nr:tetratricopeptide repeat protein [Saccharothrix sp.]
MALAEALVVLGEIHLKLDRVVEASTSLERALDLVDETTVPWVHGAALVGMGDVTERQGDPRRRGGTGSRLWSGTTGLDAVRADAVRAKLGEVG